MKYQISREAQEDVHVRALAILGNDPRIPTNTELQIWPDQNIYLDEHGNDISEYYADAKDKAIEEIKAETQEQIIIADVTISDWQGEDGWYWTVISPDGINYDDDHGPYLSREDAQEAAEEALSEE